MEISNAKVIVTGGTSGIGLEIARQLAAQGASVVICGRDAAQVAVVAENLGVYGIRADVSSEADVAALFRFALEKMGSVNVLVNNAGIGRFADLVHTATEDFEQVWQVNVKGLFLAGREAARLFINQQGGNIINIGSTASQRGYAGGSAYVASKFAVSGLTECWRAELRPHNIRVMQVNPSEVITGFIAKANMEVKNEQHKLKPAEVAHVVVSMLRMSDIGFIPDASVWATNPWQSE